MKFILLIRDIIYFNAKAKKEMGLTFKIDIASAILSLWFPIYIVIITSISKIFQNKISPKILTHIQSGLGFVIFLLGLFGTLKIILIILSKFPPKQENSFGLRKNANIIMLVFVLNLFFWFGLGVLIFYKL